MLPRCSECVGSGCGFLSLILHIDQSGQMLVLRCSNSGRIVHVRSLRWISPQDYDLGLSSVWSAATSISPEVSWPNDRGPGISD